jgi:hypothetical protein
VYDPEKGLLLVRHMAGPLHAAVGSYASRLKDIVVDAKLISMGDRHKFIVNALPQILAGHVEPPGENVKKAQAWTKIPDSSFVFQETTKKKMKPTVAKLASGGNSLHTQRNAQPLAQFLG